MKTDPRIDAYIDRQAEFAKPILAHLRAAVHAACPDCEEAMKWSSPAFLYRGQMLASMAAFKAHAAFNFWKGALVTGETDGMTSAMGQFGRLTSIADLPDDATLAALVRKAMSLTDEGVKASRTKHAKPPVEAPDDLLAALRGNAAAKAVFDAFPESAKRDYVEWITEAKREETRAKRLAQTVEWLVEGKRRNWKYESC